MTEQQIAEAQKLVDGGASYPDLASEAIDYLRDALAALKRVRTAVEGMVEAALMQAAMVPNSDRAAGIRQGAEAVGVAALGALHGKYSVTPHEGQARSVDEAVGRVQKETP